MNQPKNPPENKKNVRGGEASPPSLKEDPTHPYIKGQKAKLLEEREANLDYQESFHRVAQVLLLNGQSSAQYRTEFFDQIFIDLLNDLFSVWIHTSPEEVKKREYLYQSALALGSVKSWLLKAEQKGSNVGIMMHQQELAKKQAQQDRKQEEYDRGEIPPVEDDDDEDL